MFNYTINFTLISHIRELMSVDLNKRPRIEDVLNSKSPIFIKSLCAANKIVQDFKVELAVDKLSKEKDDLYRNKEQSLKNRENSLLQKEHAISKQENEVNAKQKQLDTREQQLNAREQQLNAREQLLNTREQQLLVRDKEVSMDKNQKEVTEPSSAVHANTKTNTSAASTRKPTTTSFKVYADPPNQNPPHVTRSKNCAVTEYMIPTAESDVNTTTGPPSANTRHRLIGDGQPNAIGVTNTLGKISDISEGVKRAKEILHRPASNNTNVAVMLGKENNGAIPSKTKPLMPPPPPPMNAIGIVTGLTTNANTMRKRSIPSRDKIDTKESPLKKPRFTGMPLQLPRSENNIQNKTTAHAYLNQKYVHQQHQVIGVSNNNNGTSSNLRDATALL